MLEERSQIRVLARGCLGGSGVLVQDTVVGSGIRVHFDALFAVKTAVRAAACRESGVGLVVASLDRRPSGNTTGNDSCHSSGGSERRVRS
jgi:hypothetical protein